VSDGLSLGIVVTIFSNKSLKAEFVVATSISAAWNKAEKVTF
jgi:hypothetical protein